MKHEIEIEGLPKGWKAVAYRCPLKGEQYLHQNQLWKAFIDESYPFIVVEKIQPRRIVLEETGEERSVSYGDWYEDNEGEVVRWANKDFGSSCCFKIWREVKKE